MQVRLISIKNWERRQGGAGGGGLSRTGGEQGVRWLVERPLSAHPHLLTQTANLLLRLLAAGGEGSLYQPPQQWGRGVGRRGR